MTGPAPARRFLVVSRGQWDEGAAKDEVQAAIDRFDAWYQHHLETGRMEAGSRLKMPGRVVSRRGITDGPFAETKELVGGYWFIVAASLDEAAALAAQNPCLAHGLTLELRELEAAPARADDLTTETPAAWRGAPSGRPPRAEPMLHHLSLGVVDIEAAACFYDAVLQPLGQARVWSDLRPGGTGQAVGYGPPGGGDRLALKQVAPGAAVAGPGCHLAFAAASPQAVEAFHAAALRAGGSDHGAPGWRPQYGEGYFAAFVIDPEGHHLEAVWRDA